MRQTNNAPDESAIDRYNDLMARAWDEIRDFLAYHYKFNRRLSTPFWRHCQEETSLGNFEGFYQAYRRLGPTPRLIHALPHRPNLYGIEGFLAMLVGMKVPHHAPVSFPDSDWEIWSRERSAIGAAADRGFTVQQSLDAIRSPDWQWS
jgi:tryptophan halogenase